MLFFIFLFGLIIGSFLNCLIWRLHTGESMMDRSHCPKCKKQIAWYDNIPVMSFLILGGKCRHCAKKISWQYPIVELATGLLFLLGWQVEAANFGFNLSKIGLQFNGANASIFFLTILRDWFLIAVMLIIFIYDLRWYLILDIVSLPACLIVFILNILLGFSWQSLVISGIIGGSFFLIQFLVSKGKWIGGGDIRLGLLMGLALGWPGVAVAIMIAYFTGSIVGLGLIAGGKKKWGSEVPLGVFLSFASIVALFWGDKIINWYFSLFG